MELRTRLARPIGALAMVATLALGAGTTLAQESTPADRIDLTNAPVDMHEGTCANPTLDPWDTIGRLRQQEFADVDDDLDDDVVDDDVDLDVDEGLLTEDLDDDDILDDEEDLNDNDILDVGIDVNDDGVLDDDEILAEGEIAIAIINLPTVWTTHGVIDAPFEPIFSQPNVIAVHQSSDQYETIVACGNLGGIPFEDVGDEVVIGLNAAGDSGLRGYAVFTYDTIIFGEDQTVVDVYLFEGLPTQRDAMMMAATPTP